MNDETKTSGLVRCHAGTTRGLCRSCSAEVLWARTKRGGHAIPLDLYPVLAGNVALEGDDSRYVSHFVTCPQAEQWRRRKAGGKHV